MYVKRRKSRGRRRTSGSLSFNRKKEKDVGRIVFLLAFSVAVLLLGVIGYYSFEHFLKDKILTKIAERAEETETEPETTVVSEETVDPAVQKAEEWEAYKQAILAIEPGIEFAEFSGEPTLTPTGDTVLDEAYRLAAGYDYDAALDLIKSVTGYGNIQEYADAVAYITAEKSALTTYKVNNNITHIFFHSLIVDPDLAFNTEVAGSKVSDYNKVMTTVYEFVNMMEEMYRKGYVLVDIYDVCKMETQPDGTEKMVYQDIRLPEGKKPFILSVDDTNYYEYMTGHGFATKLVVNEEGKVVNEMTLTDGSVVQGAFDVLPILEEFIEMHPDFSYRGGRGMMGITGYNGVLGYRTSYFWYSDNCSYYISSEANDNYKRTEITGPNKNIKKDRKTAKAVATEIKNLGWRFASHTWGHKRLGEVSMETMVWDSDMWKKEVEPILGETDLLIFPYGSDIGQTIGWKEYEYEGPNERYQTLKSYGFRYFFNVDSSVCFMQRTDEYFRQGRRNLDGERLWEAVYAQKELKKAMKKTGKSEEEIETKHKNRLKDLFDDPSSIIDPNRPEPENK